jgi:hypothetical protein
MIDLVRLREVARKHVGRLSLGMGQRLGWGSRGSVTPRREPVVNGVDQEGIRGARVAVA